MVSSQVLGITALPKGGITAGSSYNSTRLSFLEVRPVLIEKIASKQKEDPVLVERIRRLEVGTEIDDLKDFNLD